MHKHIRKSGLVLAMLTALSIGLVMVMGCTAETGSDSTSGQSQEQSGAPQQDSASDSTATDATIIDVRTADEYAAGHLDGAINIDIYKADFTDKISELDKSGSYIVYCRTGIRAGNALTIMTEQGFTDVTNGMGLQDAAKSTGLEIVK